MEILEVRDGFIKLETRKTITTGSFIEAKGNKKTYIAQVVRTVPTGEYNIVIAKMLFIYDGIFSPYDNTAPAPDAEINLFPIEEINKIFETPTSINFIKDYVSKTSIKIDKSIFNKKFLASIDNNISINNLASTLTYEFAKIGNVLTIDTLGVTEGQKFIAGVDFKLPLNTEALAFLYEECLNDATSDSKSLIKEIFQDLSEYSKSVPFLPFSTLKTIIDDMVEKQHIFKLLVLKNKLAKFDKLGYFAADSKEFEQLKNILKNKIATIDLSKLDPAFQNRYLEAIYLMFEKLEEKPQVTLLASNNLTKKTLKIVLTSNHSTTSMIVNSRFRYLKDIKPMFNTFLIESGFVNNEIFKTQASLLMTLPKDSYLLIGNGTNNIPLVTTIDYCETPRIEVLEENTNNSSELEDLLDTDVEKDEQTVAIEKKSEDFIEKISEEVETSPPSVIDNLFGSDDEEEDSDNGKLASEEEDDDDLMFKEEPVQYTTQVHTDIIVEDSEEYTETEATESEEAIDDDVIEVDMEEQIEDTESIEEAISESSNEEIVVELPADIAELSDNESLFEDDNEIQEYEPEFTEESSDVIAEYNEIIEENIEEEEEELSIIDEEIIEENSEILEAEPTSDEIFDEIVELDESDLDDDDDIIVVDVSDDDDAEISEATEKEIVEDVDKVFTTMKSEELSDSDLDFIDELNGESSNEDTLEEYSQEGTLEELSDDFTDNLEEDDGFIEPLEEFQPSEPKSDNDEILETRSASTPIVPVYDAEIPQEDTVMSDPIEQGDNVVHAKYGNGIVEKMINYGTKTLYSINFENVGRRLLDPTITEIKKA